MLFLVEPVKIPREVFSYSQNCSSRTKTFSHERAPPPEEGEIVALDSEFIRNEQVIICFTFLNQLLQIFF